MEGTDKRMAIMPARGPIRTTLNSWQVSTEEGRGSSPYERGGPRHSWSAGHGDDGEGRNYV